MPRLPKLRGKELIKILGRYGFGFALIEGSHHFIQHPDGRCSVVPVHAGEVLGLGLLLKILRDTKLSKENIDQPVSSLPLELIL